MAEDEVDDEEEEAQNALHMQFHKRYICLICQAMEGHFVQINPRILPASIAYVFPDLRFFMTSCVRDDPREIAHG